MVYDKTIHVQDVIKLELYLHIIVNIVLQKSANKVVVSSTFTGVKSVQNYFSLCVCVRESYFYIGHIPIFEMHYSCSFPID